mmetsp:Transcript_55837/g.122329  ORF Transcript_55837/g.122329 Transcript_55837/m.122329 type:complete len:235 (-) Transcript_55837:20-724(-)
MMSRVLNQCLSVLVLVAGSVILSVLISNCAVIRITNGVIFIFFSGFVGCSQKVVLDVVGVGSSFVLLSKQVVAILLSLVIINIVRLDQCGIIARVAGTAPSLIIVTSTVALHIVLLTVIILFMAVRILFKPSVKRSRSFTNVPNLLSVSGVILRVPLRINRATAWDIQGTIQSGIGIILSSFMGIGIGTRNVTPACAKLSRRNKYEGLEKNRHTGELHLSARNCRNTMKATALV